MITDWQPYKYYTYSEIDKILNKDNDFIEIEYHFQFVKRKKYEILYHGLVGYSTRYEFTKLEEATLKFNRTITCEEIPYLVTSAKLRKIIRTTKDGDIGRTYKNLVTLKVNFHGTIVILTVIDHLGNKFKTEDHYEAIEKYNLALFHLYDTEALHWQDNYKPAKGIK